MQPVAVAIVGIGKIAEDQHLPVIARDARFKLSGIVSQSGKQYPGVPSFKTQSELFRAVPEISAVAICTPPAARHALAREALLAGKHVLLEKPPTPTLAECQDLIATAQTCKRVLFATWHSRFNLAVDRARELLVGQHITRLHVEWKEDVRRWHPGQEWIWQPAGFGVFDPGINALSIVTAIVPGPLFVKSAQLLYPSNRQTPIAAKLVFASPLQAGGEAALTADFDWRQEGEQSWNISIETVAGSKLELTHGGAKLFVDGSLVVEAPMAEYEGIYDRFAALLASGTSDVDMRPFQIVSDACLVGNRQTTAAFNW